MLAVAAGGVANRTPAATPTSAIRCVGLSKSFGATHALREVDLDLGAGRIHALVGENGAGKSTLLGILAGRISATEGQVEVLGAPLSGGDPREARRAGLAAIYQELTGVGALSARDNVFLGQEQSRRGFVDEASQRERFEQLAGRLGTAVDQDARVDRLSVADQQVLEILRALQSRARVILFDEPTASLAHAEREALFAVMRELRADGVTIVLVSHNLDEVLAHADTVTVFRDGRRQATRPAAEWTKHALITSMLGRELSTTLRYEGRSTLGSAAPALSVREVSVAGVLHDVELSVGSGEILGVAGLVGSGRSTLLRTLVGAEVVTHGEMSLAGRSVAWPTSPRRAKELGVVLAPEDRKRLGLVLSRPAAENIALGDLGHASRAGIVREREVVRRAGFVARAFGFDASRLGETTANLSGGNQQKVMLARWRFSPPRILLVDEPARGVDVGAKEEILATLRAFAADGVGVVVVSSELAELSALADRVIVLAHGHVVKSLQAGSDGVAVAEMLHAAFDSDHAT